jgi:hypothetical protein
MDRFVVRARRGGLAALALFGFLVAAPLASAAPQADVKITNPPGAILVGQSYALQANGTPPGGVYTWRVLNGGNSVTPQTGTGPTFTITGTAASGRSNDVRVQVSYMGQEDRCDFTVVGIQLKSVTFGGTGYRAVAQDNVGPAYTTNHWFDNDNDGVATNTTGDRRFPALYVRNQRVTVTRLTATVAPNDFRRASVDVKGDATDNQKFVGTGAIDRGLLTVSTAMVADRPVRNTVFFYDTYDVDWQTTLTPNAFRSFGKSDNRVYVSLDTPVNATIYETVVHLACSDASGATTPARALDLIWGDFTDLDVRRKPIDGFNRRDGVRMGYWRPPQSVQQTLPEMLHSPSGNGACGAWANLLVAETRVHGIRHPATRIVEIRSDPAAVPNAAPDGFLVKNWAFRHGMVLTGANGLNDSDRKPDDNELFPKGNGFPNSICITSGPDGRVDTTPAGDDRIFGLMINTGADGICDTRADPKDVAVIQPMRGAPNLPCILAGANDVIDSTVNPDDRLVVTAKGNGPYPFLINRSAINLPGIGGQDNPEPPPSFANHFIVLAQGKFYDPSYGAGPFNTENDHENAASDGLKRGTHARRNDTAKRELTYTRM